MKTQHYDLYFVILLFTLQRLAGKVAATSENSDHGEKLNIDDLKINTAKSLINTLYLAGQVNMTGEELENLAKKIVDSN